MTGNLLTGLTGVALTNAGLRAWWGCADPAVAGRVQVMSLLVGATSPTAMLAEGRDGSGSLYGYPGRGWLAQDTGLVWPQVGAAHNDRGVIAEPCFAGGAVIAVRETDAPPKRSLVAIGPRSGDGSVIWAGSDFMGGLEPSPDGRLLSWLAWNNPDMPWDSARLMVGKIVHGAVTDARVVAGGPGRSAQPAAWTGPSTLLTSTEESGLWQLCELDVHSGAVVRRWAHAGEAGIPYWRAGTRSIVSAGTAGCVLVAGKLWRVEADHLSLIDEDGYWAPWLDGQGRYVLGVRETASTFPALTRIDVRSGQVLTIYPPPAAEARAVRRAAPQVMTVAGPGAEFTVRLYAPDGPAPWPTVLIVHGGPALASSHLLDPSLDWLTCAGYAVAVVDYSGSAGYGRGFRDRLLSRWGELDVDDCERSARYLIDHGLSDRLAIRGVSSGGWTVLHALARHGTPFAAGVALAPVTDVAAQRAYTPDFEKQYVDRLMGPVERSPSSLGLVPKRPLLIVQGERDQIVRPATTDSYVRQARQRGGNVQCLSLAGEGHLVTSDEGARQARAAELTIYQRHLLGHP